MNKKRELVNEVLNRMEAADVVLPRADEDSLGEKYALRIADADRYWKLHPNGYHKLNDDCVERTLACLNEESLQRIIDGPAISKGTKWSDLWHIWGRQGFFKCAPTIIRDTDGIPVLRIRHDSYLSWFRGYCFQNSYDVAGHGSNGTSGTDLQMAIDCITPPDTYDEFDDSKEAKERAKWCEEHAVYRKAMILSYPLFAAGRLDSFHAVLSNYPEVFEEFFNLTDDEKMCLGLDKALTMKSILELASSTCTEGPAQLEFILCDKGEACITLRYSEHYVQCSWGTENEHKSYAITIPPECDRQKAALL